jgi:hypothetical protein
VSVNLQQTTTSLSVIEDRLDSLIVSSGAVLVDQSIRSGQSLGNRGTSTPALSGAKQPLSVNEMITELHRCLVLGESPLSVFNYSIQGASSQEKSQVVSQDSCCVASGT